MTTKTNFLKTAILATFLSTNAFAVSIPATPIDLNWQDTKGVLLPTSEQMITFSTPSTQTKKIMVSWYDKTITIEDVFFAATHDKDNWIVQNWLKGEDKTSELYSIYIVLETERLKNSILNGNTKAYFDLVRLSREDNYTLKVLNSLIEQNTDTVVKAQNIAGTVGQAIKAITKYNNGGMTYKEIVTLSVHNDIIDGVLKKHYESGQSTDTIKVDVVFDKEENTLSTGSSITKIIVDTKKDSMPPVVAVETEFDNKMSPAQEFRSVANELTVALKGLKNEFIKFDAELAELAEYEKNKRELVKVLNELNRELDKKETILSGVDIKNWNLEENDDFENNTSNENKDISFNEFFSNIKNLFK